MIHGLLMAAAIEAGTTEPNEATPSFGAAGSVVLGEVVAARALTAAPAPLGVIGGAQGTWSAGWFSFASTDSGDFRTESIAAEPAFDVFVANGLSLGGTFGAGVAHLTADTPVAQDITVWHATVIPRVGTAIDLARDVALWPRFAAGFTVFDYAVENEIGKVFRATLDAPFVFRLTRHVALQTGPQLSYFNHLGGPASWRGFSGGVSGGLSIVL
jgi:hypothetical protein